MGCCMSSTTTTAAARSDSHNPKPPPIHRYSPPKRHSVHTPLEIPVTKPAPPASLEDAETVKEVLSETPTTVKPPEITPPQTICQIPIVQEPKTQAQNSIGNKRVLEEVKTPAISQASETVSAATTTTTTTTVTEIREDEATSQKRVNRSPATLRRKRPYAGERESGVAKSPAKREKSVVKRDGSGPIRSTKRNVGSSGIRRDFGDGSSRKSRSPAGRPARGRAGGSPAKVNRKPGDRSFEAGVGNGIKREETKGDNSTQQPPPQTNESIENPLVSMECFIFV